MESDKDIRWVQRFSNYRKALVKLTQAVNIITGRVADRDEVDELLKEGLIQRFEYTHELAWKVMKDYAEYQGYTEVRGSRDAFRQALQMGLIDDVAWMESIEDRNLTSHNYDEEVAEEVYEAIVHKYYPLFVRFEQPNLKAEFTLQLEVPEAWEAVSNTEVATMQVADGRKLITFHASSWVYSKRWMSPSFRSSSTSSLSTTRPVMMFTACVNLTNALR